MASLTASGEVIFEFGATILFEKITVQLKKGKRIRVMRYDVNDKLINDVPVVRTYA
jgi:hypothetical protein